MHSMTKPFLGLVASVALSFLLFNLTYMEVQRNLQQSIGSISRDSVDLKSEFEGLESRSQIAKEAVEKQEWCQGPPSPSCCAAYITTSRGPDNISVLHFHLNSSFQFQWRESATVSLYRVYPNCSTTPLLRDTSSLLALTTTLDAVPPGTLLAGAAQAQTFGTYLDSEKIVEKLGPEKGTFVGFVIVKGNQGASRGYAFPKQDKTWWQSICFSTEFPMQLSAQPWPLVKAAHRSVIPGGSWRPATCQPRWRVAVVIPYRDRDDHLRVFLNHMHSFLQLQCLQYTIYVVEHTCPTIFNRAILQNIGFTEAQKEVHYDCYYFQDVDLLPEKLENYYGCEGSPRHVVPTRSRTHYYLYSLRYFGGGVMLTPDHIQAINGFTNKVYGWGGEDNNAYHRVLAAGLTIQRYPANIGSYTMLSHGKDTGNPRNNFIIDEAEARQRETGSRIPFVYDPEYQSAVDGLSTLKYELIWKKQRSLFTHILTRVPGPNLQDPSLCGDSTNITYS